MDQIPELSIRLVNVKEEIKEEDADESIIVKNALSEHDYIVIKRETNEDNNNESLLETDEEEEEELVDFDEEEEDKIQAARTLAELSIQPVTSVRDDNLRLPDLRRSNNNGGASTRFACNICGKEYSTSSNLARHRQTHRSPDHSKARKCNLCNKVSTVK